MDWFVASAPLDVQMTSVAISFVNNDGIYLSSLHWPLKWILSFQINFPPSIDLKKASDLFSSFYDALLEGGMGPEVKNLRTRG